MDNKLSKPVAWTTREELIVACNGVAWVWLSKRAIHGEFPLYSQEYVSALIQRAERIDSMLTESIQALKSAEQRIAELEAEGKVWESAALKHLERAEEAEKRLATPVRANAVAWEMRYWSDGYNIWHEWERITAEQHVEMSVLHATDNDYEFRVLYDAPPAPAVPEDLAAAVNRLFDCDGTRGHFSAIRCRDAREEVERLLAQPVSSGCTLNSPVIPDGWIACSERMPASGGDKQTYVLAGDFKNHYWPNLPNTQVGVYGDWFNDGNPAWDDGDGNDLHLREITHWMPLPVAPEGGNG